MANPLRIAAWNANGGVARRAELAAFGTEFDLDAILLIETFLTCPFGGTAILINKQHAHRELTSPATRLLETTALA